MLRRFRTKDMILQDTPDTPEEGVIYPHVLSAEYFQGIQENTFFNHLGHNSKPKESYGVVVIELTEILESYTMPADDDDESESRSAFDRTVWRGRKNFTVNLDGTLPSGSTTSETSTKHEGVSSFTDNSSLADPNVTSYTVQLCIQDYIGVTFDGRGQINGVTPDSDIRLQQQPLINPSFPSHTRVDGLNINFEANRHTQRTRPSFINMDVIDQREDSFIITISRSNVWADVYDHEHMTSDYDESNIRDVVIHDYEYTGTAPEINVPTNYTGLDPIVASAVNPTLITTNITSHPRNLITVAWIAKGV